ncbi:ATP-binding cassette domain-containing protein, partial [Escherichia sp. TWPC-MK]
NNLSWQVNPGEHWQIVGPNGAGKSTLLSLITGDHSQTTADVTDMLFDIPDGFAAAATSAEKRQIVAVTLRMIASNQAKWCGKIDV